MVLPGKVMFCDACEMAAIAAAGTQLFVGDFSRQFFPGLDHEDVEPQILEMLGLAAARRNAIRTVYPFEVTERSLRFAGTADFNIYTFLLLGKSLDFGGPANVDHLTTYYRRYFEDAVCWALRRAGFVVEILSIPREFRGLPQALAPALREVSTRFGESAILLEDKLMPHDNDLDVDVLASPCLGNTSRGGWPTFQIQCATGAVTLLQSKLQEGSETFGTVWEKGFYPGSAIRAVATHDDLLALHDVHWDRLGKAGWVIDRTKIAHLSSGERPIAHVNEFINFWAELWAARIEIGWQNALE
jgi:hypothetical protein